MVKRIIGIGMAVIGLCVIVWMGWQLRPEPGAFCTWNGILAFNARIPVEACGVQDVIPYSDYANGVSYRYMLAANDPEWETHISSGAYVVPDGNWAAWECSETNLPDGRVQVSIRGYRAPFSPWEKVKAYVVGAIERVPALVWVGLVFGFICGLTGYLKAGLHRW